MKNTKQNVILLVIVVCLVVFPLVFIKGGEFGGSDDQGTAQIKKNDPSYRVWAHPLWTPPSGEIETLIFTLQGSFGTGVIAYIIGFARGKKKNSKEE
ncbi:energy-coupling factor ABC transporter substrate-binding protein [Pediococcus claussenii]|uniref:Cobalt transport protein CbiN n=1 Tax=Pediococcus claussenii (strain ATCC BAA-344 / DSM 14800 / JCM 18046 / KCTC 3811 / LMG 21948 / P06) TaxID=701521 RepID=G8PEW6_PEDCP|nr:energy-coupling factor ABC transporter substrate-binding protein [Pediococcus claussenii]AEV95645.1 cobalt transport protein CbiN [Pediococcus claussenii ATCC BAA-344]ANZ69165.1 cobalt ABC transporter substrate-binding protein CbiN [Pediococcus claussenii]ANZ70982.1 cobalt ABC transporter substrate-binding protein CbiN [Pediococcus claussenii]KRN20122.1 cbiN protein [Pediococcus claussenii]